MTEVSYQDVSPAKVGWTVFAATMMIIIGLADVFYGIAAIAKDNYFVVSTNYLYKFNTTAWGWIHLVLGLLVLVAGFALFSGATWARVVGIAVAGLSLIGNFLAIPVQPVWSIVIIAVDVAVIWALCAPTSW